MSGDSFQVQPGEVVRFTGEPPELSLHHYLPGQEVTDRAANLTAAFLPASPDEESSLPAVQIANLLVFVYVRDGELRLTVDTEDTGGSCVVRPRLKAGSLTGHAPCLDLHVCVNDGTVYQNRVDIS